MARFLASWANAWCRLCRHCVRFLAHFGGIFAPPSRLKKWHVFAETATRHRHVPASQVSSFSSALRSTSGSSRVKSRLTRNFAPSPAAPPAPAFLFFFAPASFFPKTGCVPGGKAHCPSSLRSRTSGGPRFFWAGLSPRAAPKRAWAVSFLFLSAAPRVTTSHCPQWASASRPSTYGIRSSVVTIPPDVTASK